MSANIKIGNDTLQGVNAVELENADALGSYVKFSFEHINPEKPTQEKTITVTENSTTEVTPDSGKVLSKVTIITNIQTAVPEEVSTAEAMDALLVAVNVGKAYKFTGTTDDTYTNSDIYVVKQEG